jgi:hypothetical protein
VSSAVGYSFTSPAGYGSAKEKGDEVSEQIFFSVDSIQNGIFRTFDELKFS